LNPLKISGGSIRKDLQDFLTTYNATAMTTPKDPEKKLYYGDDTKPLLPPPPKKHLVEASEEETLAMNRNVLLANQQILGTDGGFSRIPACARFPFFSFTAAELLVLAFNVYTMSPLTFERIMGYHLHYSALTLCYWCATYVGLDMGKYPGCQTLLRTKIGLFMFVVFGMGGILMTEGGTFLPAYGPWPAYVWIGTGFSVMSVVDFLLLRRFLIPTWIFRWKFMLNIVTLSSLLVGFVKGRYLERHAEYYITRAAIGEGQYVLGEIY